MWGLITIFELHLRSLLRSFDVLIHAMAPHSPPSAANTQVQRVSGIIPVSLKILIISMVKAVSATAMTTRITSIVRISFGVLLALAFARRRFRRRHQSFSLLLFLAAIWITSF